MIEKGKANGGTEAGFWIATIGKYSDIFVKVFDVYNTCKIDYFMISLGKQLTSISGGVGFITNLGGLLLVDATASSTSNAGISFPDLNNALA